MHLIEITDIDDTAAIGHFLGLANDVYREDAIWVAASDNLFLQRFKVAQTDQSVRMKPFVALADDGCPVARAAAIMVTGASDAEGKPQGWIGFFESKKDCPEAAVAILEKCEQALVTAGARSVLAPKIDNLVLGLQTDGFSFPQTVYTNHNPPYYLDIFLKSSYKIKARLQTFLFTKSDFVFSEIKLPGFGTRTFDRNNIEREIQIFHDLQNSLFTGGMGYVPRTLDEDRDLVSSFLPFIDDELIIIAEDTSGNQVGLLVCLPDIYQLAHEGKIDRARLISIGVLNGWSRNGVGAMMGSHLAKNLLAKGYTVAEASWIFEDNKPPQNLAKRFQALPAREFVLLEKSLEW